MQTQPQEKENNGACLVGFILGCASIILYPTVIIQLAGLIISIIGLLTFKKSKHKHYWMGPTGLVLSIVYCYSGLVYHGFLY